MWQTLYLRMETKQRQWHEWHAPHPPGTWSSKWDRCVKWALQDSMVRPQCGNSPGAADRRGTPEPTGGVLVEGDTGVGLENEYHIPDGRQEPKVPPPRGTTCVSEGRVDTWEAPEARSGRGLCQECDRRARALGGEKSRPCSRYWIPGPERHRAQHLPSWSSQSLGVHRSLCSHTMTVKVWGWGKQVKAKRYKLSAMR